MSLIFAISNMEKWVKWVNMSSVLGIINTSFDNEIIDQIENETEEKETKYTGRVFIENWDLDSTLYHNSDTNTILPLF